MLPPFIKSNKVLLFRGEVNEDGFVAAAEENEEEDEEEEKYRDFWYCMICMILSFSSFGSSIRQGFSSSSSSVISDAIYDMFYVMKE